MKNIILFCLFLFVLFSCETKTKTSSPSKILNKIDIEKKHEPFLNFISQKIVTAPDEQKYISNIEQLRKVKLISCDSQSIQYQDIIDGKEISLVLEIQKFQPEEHQIEHGENGKNDFKSIDGLIPWGAFYGGPITEIKNVLISWDNEIIQVDTFFQNIYNIDLCNDNYIRNFSPNPLLAYDKKNKVFYFYIYGGNAANSYFSKFIFDGKKMLYRYILDHLDMVDHAPHPLIFQGF